MHLCPGGVPQVVWSRGLVDGAQTRAQICVHDLCHLCHLGEYGFALWSYLDVPMNFNVFPSVDKT